MARGRKPAGSVFGAALDGPKNRSEPVDDRSAGDARFADNPLDGMDGMTAEQIGQKLINPEFETFPALDAEAMAKARALAFMNEMITVDILPSHSENDDEYFVVEVNERKVVFHRGDRQTVPRWAIEGLARAKPAGYGNVEYYKPDGTRDIKWPKRVGERYPFAVFHDPNPDGPRWLQQVRAQP